MRSREARASDPIRPATGSSAQTNMRSGRIKEDLPQVLMVTGPPEQGKSVLSKHVLSSIQQK
jgi:hypothetical protein